MQTKLISAAALLLAATLSHAADGKKAAASIPDNTPILMQAEVGSLDKRVEVAYVCDSQQGKRNVNAMYGIKDGETAVVQIKVGDQVPWRGALLRARPCGDDGPQHGGGAGLPWQRRRGPW